MVELGALMRCIGNFGSAVLIKLVQLSHDCQVVELLVERRGGIVVTNDLALPEHRDRKSVVLRERCRSP